VEGRSAGKVSEVGLLPPILSYRPLFSPVTRVVGEGR
jgi:hypothetical protein